MPDHVHLIWIGCRDSSDQLLATLSLRTEVNRLFAPAKLQKQAHDHVLREEERRRDVFAATWRYVAENPERAELVEDWREYPHLGSMVPGFMGLDPRRDDFFESFWRVFNAFGARGG